MDGKPEESKSDLAESVEEVSHAVTAITKMDAVIGELTQEFSGVIFDVDNPDGMKAAKAARKKIRDPRYLIERLRKEGKRPLLDLGRRLDAKAGEQTERLLAIEGPIDTSIKEEETRAERERQAKIEAEQKRVEAIQERIVNIRSAVDDATRQNLPSDQLAQWIADIAAEPIDDSFEEFQQQAQDAKDATLGRLREIHAATVAREAEEARILAEREELERLRAEAAERQAKEDAERKAREDKERKEREEKEAAERKAREAEEAKRRAELEAQRKKQAEEQAKIDAENKRIADERAALEREREAARQREVEAARKKAADEKAAAEAKAKAEALARKARYPGDDALISALAEHFEVTEFVARQWLKQYGKQRAA